MAPEWVAVCRLDELDVDRGAAALVHGQAVTVFRTAAGGLHVIGNRDPLQPALSLARGTVGRRGDVPFVALPRHRRAFDLRAARCLDDPQVAVPAYDVRLVDGVVLVGRRLPRP